MNTFKKVAAFILIAMLIMSATSFAQSESPSIEGMTYFKEGFLKKSSFPNNLVPTEIVRVDMDTSKLNDGAKFTSVVRFLYLPDDIAFVALTDGVHIAFANWAREEDTLNLDFSYYDITNFDSSVGLWLIVVQQIK